MASSWTACRHCRRPALYPTSERHAQSASCRFRIGCSAMAVRSIRRFETRCRHWRRVVRCESSSVRDTILQRPTRNLSLHFVGDRPSSDNSPSIRKARFGDISHRSLSPSCTRTTPLSPPCPFVSVLVPGDSAPPTLASIPAGSLATPFPRCESDSRSQAFSCKFSTQFV